MLYNWNAVRLQGIRDGASQRRAECWCMSLTRQFQNQIVDKEVLATRKVHAEFSEQNAQSQKMPPLAVVDR